MKKIIFGSAALLIVGITAALGLLNATFRYDDIGEQEYRISLKKAAMIVKEEAYQKKVNAIQFSAQKDIQNPTNNNFEYLFIYLDEVIAVNPTTGQTATRLINTTENKLYSPFDIEKVATIKTPQTAMKEATKQWQQKKAKAKNWKLLTKKGKLYYEIILFDDKEERRLLIRA